MKTYLSWGRFPKISHQQIFQAVEKSPFPSARSGKSMLAYGAGRSYGDCCLNEGGILLDTSRMDRVLDFDAEHGLLRCEGGISLGAILRLIIPHRWFLPVVPGTQFVTLGGAIANDVHGKNHHRAGTFGGHVTKLELLRSDGTRLLCSRQENSGFFNATVAGLGLTGLILWAELRLKKTQGPFLDCETWAFSSLQDFSALCEASDRDFEYTVAWVDALARGSNFGRGIFFRGNHAPEVAPERGSGRFRMTVPMEMPGFMLNSFTLGVFNELYFQHHRHWAGKKRVHYEKFFFPLDGLRNWNRLYGRAGFFQYQCAIPGDRGLSVIASILKEISRAGLGASLAVLKKFGPQNSPGLLSFPREGMTLSVDLKNEGTRTLSLMQRLDYQVQEAGGAVYPAKDACMSSGLFTSGFPRAGEFETFRDPEFSSNFWRRVCAEAAQGGHS